MAGTLHKAGHCQRCAAGPAGMKKAACAALEVLRTHSRDQWHGLEAEVIPLCEGETFSVHDFDILFFGLNLILNL
jgi:hypothetical protein